MNIEQVRSFERSAAIAQGIKREMQASPNWDTLREDTKEALEGMASEISHLLCGDSEGIAHWSTISVYARLVEARIDVDNEA